MGLDISANFDNAEDFLYDHEFEDDVNWENRHELSRNFCNLMCRKDVIEGKPELDQIAQKAEIDISPLYQMLNYWSEDAIEEHIEFEDEIDEDEFRESCRKQNLVVEGNIDLLINVLRKIIVYLEKKKDVSGEVNHYGFDTLGAEYFKNLDAAESNNYVNNNLVQDLRNLVRMAEFGKENGAKTIFFELG